MIEKGDEVEAGKSPTNNSTDETVVPKPPKEKRPEKLTKKVLGNTRINTHVVTNSSWVKSPTTFAICAKTRPAVALIIRKYFEQVHEASIIRRGNHDIRVVIRTFWIFRTFIGRSTRGQADEGGTGKQDMEGSDCFSLGSI